MKILVLDNYDSFTFNLVQYIQEILGQKVDVRRNDAIALDAVAGYNAIILSPGPGLPSEAGIMPELIRRYAAEKAILGVCLGHQAIGEAFGAELENLTQVYHGVETPITVTMPDEPLFMNIPEQFQAGRYHSLYASQVPECLKVVARTADSVPMAVEHRSLPLLAVQFHPESILTLRGNAGLRLVANVVHYAAEHRLNATRVKHGTV